MIGGRKKEVIVQVKSEEEFLNYYSEENQKLVVLDIHPSWSGACELMNPTYKSLATQIDDFEKRIDIISMDSEVLKNYKNEKFNCTCKPKFMLILKGKIIGEVDGVNVPLLMEKIMKNIPY